MNDFILDVKSRKGFSKVSFLAINTESIDFTKTSYEGKDFYAKVNVELLDKDELILDYGYGLINFKVEDLIKEEGKDVCVAEIYLKGFDKERFPVDVVSVYIDDVQKAVLDKVFNPKDILKDISKGIKEQYDSVVKKDEDGNVEILKRVKESFSNAEQVIKEKAKTGKDTTKDFIKRAKNNELSKKEKILSGLAIGVAALAILNKQNKK